MGLSSRPDVKQSSDLEIYALATAGTYSGLQSDTVAAGLLQRCVVRCSSRQYLEAATRAEHGDADRSTGAKEVTCSAAPGTAALAASPPVVYKALQDTTSLTFDL